MTKQYKIPTYKCRLVKDGSINSNRLTIREACEAYDVFNNRLKNLPHEEIHMAFLNARSEIIGLITLAVGGSHGAGIMVKDIFRPALAANAVGIILCHNHPSGDPEPSFEDIDMTKKVKDAGEVIGISLLDHLVICPEKKLFRSIIEMI